MAKYDITSKVLFQDYERDFIACFCILSNLVYEMDLVQKLVKEVQTMIDFENIPLIKMYTEKARLEERERAQEELREAYTNVLLQIIDQEFGKRGVEELEPPYASS